MSDLLFHLRSLSRLIYVVTEEEDRFLLNLKDILKSKYTQRTKVLNAALGLVPLEQLTRDWQTRDHTLGKPGPAQIHDALVEMYTDDPKDEQNFYVITDPERWLGDAHIQRRILNIVHQLHNDIRTIKILIFVGTRKAIPEKLARYMEVVEDKGLQAEDVDKIVGEACSHLKLPKPADTFDMFRGLTDWEVNASIAQSVARMKQDKIPQEERALRSDYIAEFKRRQIAKTNLVKYIDTTGVDFAKVGGMHRYKSWAMKTKAAWTSEGRAFGLEVPKGVLNVGVWGCGKSLSVKALANEWGLPLLQLETGNLRKSGVGDTEARTYQALRIIEQAAPCVVWIDEAEKSLSGGQSSAQSDAGTTNRQIGIISTWMQESNAPVCMAMTANTLNTMPVEFVNRMDERWYFMQPDLDDRIDILKIHLSARGQDTSRFDLAKLSEQAEGLVGREMEQAIKAAFVESFAQQKPSLDGDILGELLGRKPRIIKTMTDEIAQVIEWVGYDADVDDGIRAKYASNPKVKGSGGPKVVSG